MASHENKRPAPERRDFKLDLSKCEVRSAEGDAPATFSGYAAVFNELSVNLGGFRERIQPGAFRSAVEDGQDVRFLINHDSNLILGRTPRTITLTEDEIGLRVECELPNTSYANDLVESMRREDINQMSFGFITRSDDWKEKDAETGLPIRELIEADLFDVSVVTYPAYPDTTAEVRTYIAEHNPELLDRAKRAAEDLEELNVITTPETDTESELDRARAAFEEARALAGVRIQDDHPCCDGVAVVWNFNDEVQSCHQSRDAAEAQIEAMTSGAAGAARETDTDKEERVGKKLSAATSEKLTQAQELLAEVLSAAAAIEDSTVVETVELNDHKPEAAEQRELPDLAAFRASLEERAWDWEDDMAVWSLTQMIEAASCFMVSASYNAALEDDAADNAQAQAMQSIITQLTELLTAVVAEGGRSGEAETEKRDETDPVEERDETLDEERTERFEAERRKIRLAELELELV
jgi:hypothetical protein